MKKHLNNEDIDKLVEEYYMLDFEDLIAGGLKTRFKYVETEPQNFGLNDEQLLLADDQVLNNYVPLKKITPYGEFKV